MTNIALAIHGGAGNILKKKMNHELEKRRHSSLARALNEAFKMLLRGSTSLSAVEKAVMILEDDPLFNAGKGSVFTNAGNHELDAAIMCGATLKAGAVAGVGHIKNPIELARFILEDDDFILLTGSGAEEYALQKGLALVPNHYFSTAYRKKQFEYAQKLELASLVPDAEEDESYFGTVGAVALDQFGNLSAATSTGGLTNKVFGRVGDSPLIGCGTYANNKTCAVSCTGRGEYFITNVLAHDFSCLMEYRGLSLKEAGQLIFDGKMKGMKDIGGLIALDKNGSVEFFYNTKGMYRGFITSENAKAETFIY